MSDVNETELKPCPWCGAAINDGSWIVRGKYLCGSYKTQSNRCRINQLSQQIAIAKAGLEAIVKEHEFMGGNCAIVQIARETLAKLEGK